MKEINIKNSNDSWLKLVFLDAISPSEVPSKADILYFCYKLVFKEKRITSCLYSDVYFYDKNKDLLFLSAYHEDLLDPEKTRYPSDVSMFLVAIDFANLKIAKFSNLQGGYYSSFQIEDNKLYYKKYKGSIIQDTEVSLPDLKWEDLRF